MRFIQYSMMVIIVILLLSACMPVAAPTTTAEPTTTRTPSATTTITRSPTPSQTATITPIPTSTPTPTEVKLAYEEIGPETAERLSLLNVIGFSSIQKIKYSSDGAQIAIITDLKTCFYDTKTFEQINCLWSVYFNSSWLLSDDFSTLLIGGVNKIAVVNTADGSSVEQSPEDLFCERSQDWGGVVPLALSPDKRNAVLSNCGKCLVWDLVAHQVNPYDITDCHPRYSKVSFSPDGQYLFRNVLEPGTEKDVLEIVTLPGYQLVKKLYPDKDVIWNISISPDQRHFAVIGADDKLSGLGFSPGGGIRSLFVYTIEGKLVHRSENNDTYGFLQGGALFYRIVNGMRMEYDTSMWGQPISSVESPAWAAIAPDSSGAVIQGDDGIEFWRLEPQEKASSVIGTLDAKLGEPLSWYDGFVRFTQDNHALWVGTVKYDLLTGTELERIELNFKSAGLCYFAIGLGLQEETIVSFDISLDERFAVYVTDCSRVVLLDLLNGEEYTLRPFGKVSLDYDLLFTPDSKYLIVENNEHNGQHRLYNLSDLDHPLDLESRLIPWIRSGVITSSKNWQKEGDLHDLPDTVDYMYQIAPSGMPYYYDTEVSPVLHSDEKYNEPIVFETDIQGSFGIEIFIPNSSLVLGRIQEGNAWWDGYRVYYYGVWDLTTGNLLKKFPFNSKYGDMLFALSHDGTMIAVMDTSIGGLQLWGIPQP